jgi:hypothetical protein
MHKRCYHHENVKNIVGAAPHVELARLDWLGEAECIEGRAENEDGAFEEIVWHACLPPCSVETIDQNPVDDRCKAREASRDKDNGAEVAPFATLEAWVEDEEGRKDAEGEDLQLVSAW